MSILRLESEGRRLDRLDRLDRLTDGTELNDSEYSERLKQTFFVKAELIVAARQAGRGIAERDKQLDRNEQGRVAARAYRQLALPPGTDEETQSLLEQVFLVAYTTEYYR